MSCTTLFRQLTNKHQKPPKDTVLCTNHRKRNFIEIQLCVPLWLQYFCSHHPRARLVRRVSRERGVATLAHRAPSRIRGNTAVIAPTPASIVDNSGGRAQRARVSSRGAAAKAEESSMQNDGSDDDNAAYLKVGYKVEARKS